jgi:hypothetical protein
MRFALYNKERITMRKFISNFTSQYLAVGIVCMIAEIFMLLLCHYIHGREVTQKMLASLNGTDLLLIGFGYPLLWTIAINMPMNWAVDKLNKL